MTTEWIELEKQRPLAGELCLVWYTPAGGDLWHYGIMEWDDVRGLFRDTLGENVRVSHWCPLPGPP